MKKMILSIAAAVVLISQTGFAAGRTGEFEKAEATLKKEFAGAHNISWSHMEKHSLVYASFTFNDQRLNAYFNEEGELVATGRYLEASFLPLQVTRALISDYAEYQMGDVIELVKDGNTQYIINLENAKKSILVEFYDDGSSSVIKKTKKSNT